MSEVMQPFVLGGKNILEIKDKISGALLEFYYRMPTQAERDAYQKSIIKHKGNKVLSKANTFQEQTALGKRLLTGFKKGCLANEAGQIISSDQDDPAYNPTWKSLIEKHRPDFLAAVGRRVINSTVSPDEENNLEVVEDFGEDPSKSLFDDISTDAEVPTAPLPSA